MADEKNNEITNATFEKITNGKIEKIKASSVISLPDNPVAYGYSANEIRGRFVNPFFAEKDSLLAEILRIEDALEEWQKVPVEGTGEGQGNSEGDAQPSSDRSPLVNQKYVDGLIPNALNNEGEKGSIRQAIALDISSALENALNNEGEKGSIRQAIALDISSALESAVNNDNGVIKDAIESKAEKLYMRMSSEGDYRILFGFEDAENPIAEIDLPLESMIIGGSYDKGVLTLKLRNEEGHIDDNEINIDISELIDGLVNSTAYDEDKKEIEKKIASNASDLEAFKKTFEKYVDDAIEQAITSVLEGEV